jgi:two-component system sensor histidine kinase KdpD
LIHNSGTIDVYVISSTDKNQEKTLDEEPLFPVPPPSDYIASLFVVLVITLFGVLIRPFISPTNVAMLYVLGVVAVAWRRGLRPAIFTSVIGVLAFDLLFIPPYLSFRITDTEYLITLAGMIIVGSLISLLVARAKDYADAAHIRERETSTLYGLSQDLAVAVTTDSIINAVRKHISEIFEWDSVFLLPKQESLIVHSASQGLVLDDDDVAVATWAYQHGAVAGYDTDTLHGSRLRYIPLNGTQGVVGIMGVRPTEVNGIITPEQSRILTAFANQTAISLERVNLTITNR